MIPIETVEHLITGMLCFQVATLIGLVYLATKDRSSRQAPAQKAGLMSELYRGKP
jgi:hypothetical protein